MTDTKITLSVQRGLVEIIDDLAGILGLTREEAVLHMLRNEAIHWHAAMRHIRQTDLKP